MSFYPGQRRLDGVLCVILALCGAAFAVAPARADEVDVLILTDKTRSVRHFDRLELANGRVLHISPRWTSEQRLSRPLKGSKFTEVRYVLYDQPDEKGRIGIPLASVAKVTLWEELALAAARKKFADKEDELAGYLLDELEAFNAKYGVSERTTLRNAIELRAAVEGVKRARKGTPQFDQAMATLESLRQAKPATPGMSAAIEEFYVPIAKRLYADARYAECHDYLKRIRAVAPDSRPLKEIETQMRGDAAKLMNSAEVALQDDRGRQATLDALRAIKIDPDSATLKSRAATILNAYQILYVASYEAVVALDPFNAKRPLEKQLSRLLFDRLVETDETGRQFSAGPLVESMKPLPGFRAKDGSYAIAFDVVLKRDQFFSDGTRVTAAAIDGTVHGLQNPDGAAFDPELARLLMGVEVKDPFHLTLLVRQHPYPESYFTFPIAPTTLTTRIPKAGDQLSRTPIGSGPFVVAGHATFTEPLRLRANSRYRGAGEGQPLIKEIAFPRYQKKGEGHAEEDLLQRRIHMISDPSPNQLNRLRSASSEFQTRPLLSNSVWILAVNHRNPVCANPKIRRAMQLAIDRPAILKQYFAAGGAAVVTGPFPPHSNANDPTIQVEPPQPAVARKLLSDATNAASLTTLTLKYPDDLTIEQAAVQIKRDLEAVGFRIDLVKKLSNDLLHEVADRHDFDLAYWRIDHDNVLFSIASLFDASPQALAVGGANFMGYAPQSLTQRFVDLRNAQKGEEIWKIQQRIHRLLHDDTAFVPLWRLDHFMVYTNRLRGRDRNGRLVDLPFDQSMIFRQPEDWVLEPVQ